MKYIEAATQWERVGAEILGARKENYQIIVAVDYFTKWFETKGVPIATATAVTEFAVEQIVLRHYGHY